MTIRKRRHEAFDNTTPATQPKATANPGGLFICGGDEWIGIGRLVALTSLSAASVARLVDAGMFPPPLKRGRVRLWRMADVLMWVDAPASYRVCRLPLTGN